MIELAAKKRSAARLLDRPPLADGLAAIDLGLRFRQINKRRHDQGSLPRSEPIQRRCSV